MTMTVQDPTSTAAAAGAAAAHVTESDAVAIALYGTTFARWRVGYAALRKLMLDPEDTQQTFILAAVLDRNHISKPFLRFMADQSGFELMRDQPAIDSTTLDFEALKELPPGTLGHEYAHHMLSHGLDPDIFQAPPGAPVAIAYLAKRLRQTHDIWHVLTGYGTDIPGEVELQAFVFGQFATPAPGLTAVFGTLRCTFIDNPLAALNVARAYLRGKRASFLLAVRWEDFWAEPLETLREKFGLEQPKASSPANPAYQVDDQSLLIGLYRRVLWDRLTARIPRSVHPNALTVASQVFAVLAAISSAIAITRSAPVFFAAAAFCLMTCLTLDNLDGAHARRTGQCSALGELLDHGLDGLTSAAVLISTSFVLRLDGVAMVTLCTLGAFAFAGVFWEQFRTGVLRLPKVSPTEGVTVLAGWHLVAALAGDPWWLRFSLERVTAGTIGVALFVVAHVAAILTPIVRSAKVGVKAWQVAPLLPLTVIQIAFAAFGAAAIVPAITVGLIAADVTSQMLKLRYRGKSGPIVTPALYVAALPFIIHVAVPQAWMSATGWAVVSLAIVAAHYVWTLWRHGRQLMSALHGEASPIAPAR